MGFAKNTWVLVVLLAPAFVFPWDSASAEDIETRLGEVYADRESGPLRADIYLPKGEGPYPGVLVVHGGAWAMGTRVQLAGFSRMLAREGLAAVAISYRLAPTHKFPAQIEDCKTAIRWMRKNASDLRIDPKRLGAYGYSAGAHLAALLGTTDADDGLEGVADPGQYPDTRLQAVAGGGLPSDFRVLDPDSRRLSFWLGGTRREKAEVYRLASPRAFVTEDDPPMFFFHAENDRLVPMLSAEVMCKSLEDAGVHSELYVVPELNHHLALYDREAMKKSVTFLAKNLAGSKQP